jgi:hypothetical protein
LLCYYKTHRKAEPRPRRRFGYTAATMTGSLYLTPTDIRAAPPLEQVRRSLHDIGFIGAALSPQRFLAGDQLLRYLTFAGCSPHLQFEPPGDGSDGFCHVALLGPFAAPRMLVGPNTLNPRCPSCKQRVHDWRPLQAAWAAAPGEAQWQCPACGESHPIERWRWRQHALFGRVFVAVRQVFPSEAVADDRLLVTLQAATGVTWRFGWAA